MSPGNGAKITDNAQTDFDATAWNPQVGTNNGAGIDRIVFQILGPDGKSISGRQESAAAYCAYGGNGPCSTLKNSDFKKLQPGTYTIIVQAFAADGRMATATHTFEIDP